MDNFETSTHALRRQLSSYVSHCYVMVEGKGIEPLTHACKAHVFPLAPTPRILGDQGGNRTPTSGFGDHRTAIILPGHVSNTLLPMCVSKHTNKVSSVVYLEGKCASILRNFTTSVFTTSFPSSGPPTFVV